MLLLYLYLLCSAILHKEQIKTNNHSLLCFWVDIIYKSVLEDNFRIVSEQLDYFIPILKNKILACTFWRRPSVIYWLVWVLVTHHFMYWLNDMGFCQKLIHFACGKADKQYTNDTNYPEGIATTNKLESSLFSRSPDCNKVRMSQFVNTASLNLFSMIYSACFNFCFVRNRSDIRPGLSFPSWSLHIDLSNPRRGPKTNFTTCPLCPCHINFYLPSPKLWSLSRLAVFVPAGRKTLRLVIFLWYTYIGIAPILIWDRLWPNICYKCQRTCDLQARLHLSNSLYLNVQIQILGICLQKCYISWNPLEFYTELILGASTQGIRIV